MTKRQKTKKKLWFSCHRFLQQRTQRFRDWTRKAFFPLLNSHILNGFQHFNHIIIQWNAYVFNNARFRNHLMVKCGLSTRCELFLLTQLISATDFSADLYSCARISNSVFFFLLRREKPVHFASISHGWIGDFSATWKFIFNPLFELNALVLNDRIRFQRRFAGESIIIAPKCRFNANNRVNGPIFNGRVHSSTLRAECQIHHFRT